MLFQFHKGSIQTGTASFSAAQNYGFQFHKGSIQTLPR